MMTRCANDQLPDDMSKTETAALLRRYHSLSSRLLRSASACLTRLHLSDSMASQSASIKGQLQLGVLQLEASSSTLMVAVHFCACSCHGCEMAKQP
eukprot:3706465-Amphidinium_carterae.2